MLRITTCGLTLLAFAPAALAVDGTVLINQSTITNGLTGCLTGGHFPVIICQAGSYKLSGNLTVPDANTDGIDITADNVTIDLNGFAILGPTGCTAPVSFVTSCSPTGGGNGIFTFNANIVVTNGQIKGMGANGINLLGTNSRVQNIHATSNGSIGIQTAFGSLASSCSVTSNGATGISAFGSNSVVTGNLVSLNHGDGIFAEQAVLITGNSTAFNGSGGIFLTCPSVISGNVVFGNAAGNIGTTGSGCVLVNNAAP